MTLEDEKLITRRKNRLSDKQKRWLLIGLAIVAIISLILFEYIRKIIIS